MFFDLFNFSCRFEDVVFVVVVIYFYFVILYYISWYLNGLFLFRIFLKGMISILSMNFIFNVYFVFNIIIFLVYNRYLLKIC